MIELTYTQAIERQKLKYSLIRTRAMSKGMVFDIDFHVFGELMSRPCDYCNGETTGLDRKDNELGYIPENVTPSCRRCNSVKGHKITYEEMKIMGRDIARVDYEVEHGL